MQLPYFLLEPKTWVLVSVRVVVLGYPCLGLDSSYLRFAINNRKVFNKTTYPPKTRPSTTPLVYPTKMNIQDQEIVCHSKQQLRILNKFRKRLEKEKYINNYASNYYGNMHNRFSIPGIIITGTSSIASFLSTMDVINNTVKTAISIGVGIMAACSTIIYSIANSYGFQSRRDSFQISADAYDDLITKIEFEIVNPNENFNEFCNSLETQILKIKTDCKYLPPLFIYKMYEKEVRKMKLTGVDEEHEASLDFVISADNSPSRGGVPATPVVNNSGNKQIKLPGPSTVIQMPSIISSESITNSAPATYFNDLAGMGSQIGTTVNKLAAGVLSNNLTNVISIPNLDMLSEPSTASSAELSGRASINIVNMDGVDMDGASSV